MERRAIAIQGTVQGVGFRPFVYTLAARLQLGGFVRNDTGGVQIEVEGEAAGLDEFLTQLVEAPPPLARIEGMSWERRTLRGERAFNIQASETAAAGAVAVAADVATCAECLAEMADPANRRYGYPFINCTNCGPRLTIVTGAPYDRARTTMSGFAMCAACRAEYENPRDRRFHAEATACAVCGPRLSAWDGDGQDVGAADPLGWAVAAIAAGKIVAMKGLGGYHLVCAANNGATVAELRRRKHRYEKPLAVMVGDLATAERLGEVSAAERGLLASAHRPIVLLKRRGTGEVAAEVAPGNPRLGVMLPYTPLHHLLLAAMQGEALVMTSGNRADEPIAIDEAGAVERLRGIADVFLVHNRPIHVRCDDSVTRVMSGIESPVRRSRGYAPQALRLRCGRPILAVGGQLKVTFALAGQDRVILSHHLGDLDLLEASEALARDIALYERLFGLRPEVIAHDLHPDYASSVYARRRAAAEGIPTVAVQHHHAHLASCMAEHGLTQRVIGVTFDGSGLGTDGAIWGGEILVGDLRGFERGAHLRYVGLPGGEQAVREPWRMAAAHLHDAGANCAALEGRHEGRVLRNVRKMVERGFNSPLTSSAGRLFDAVAALAGVRDVVSYEGQAAMELEWLATGVGERGAYPVEMQSAAGTGPLVIDTRPLIRAVAQEVDAGEKSAMIARRFVTTMVELIAMACARMRAATGIETVVLSGGVFMNALLSEETIQRLDRDGFATYRHRLVPPNDGGLSLGQAAVAAAQTL